MIDQSVDQSSRIIPISRMNDEAARFIDDEQRIVFIEHIQIQILWNEFEFSYRVGHDN